MSGALLGSVDGWGSVFYFFGTVGFVWIIIFVSNLEIRNSRALIDRQISVSIVANLLQ